MAGELKIKNASSNIMQGFARKYIDAMEKTFSKFNIWKRCYSIGSEKDCATCIVYRNNKWDVFYYEKQTEIGKKSFEDDDVSEACLNMILNVAEDKNQGGEMQKYYDKLLRKIQSSDLIQRI